MKERLLQAVNFGKVDVFKLGFFALTGFFLSGAQICSSVSPFGVAFCMAVPYNAILPAFIGSLTGYLIFSGSGAGLYAAAALLGAFIKILFFPRADNALVSSGISFGALSVVYILSTIIYPVGIGTWLVYLAEVFLCAAMTFLYFSAFNKENRSRYNSIELVCFGLVGATVLISICNISFFGFNLGRLAAAVCIMGAASSVGAAGGAVCGLVCTIALGLYTKDFALCGAIYSVAGLTAGVFKPLSRGVQAVLFVGTVALCGAFIGGLQSQALIEAAVGAIIALFIPFERVLNIKSSGQLAQTNISTLQPTNDLAARLEFTAGTLVELQNLVEECAKCLDGKSERDLSIIYQKTADDVCRRCGLNTFCWVTAYSDIMKAFSAVSESLRINGTITEDKLPPFFNQKCCNIKSLVDSINGGYREHLSKQQAARRVNQARQIATEQFSGVSQMLLEMSEELSDVVSFDENGASAVKNIMRDRGINFSNVFCLVDRFDRMTVDIYFDSKPGLTELQDLTGYISDDLEREFDLPNFVSADDRYKISFYETAALQIDFAVAQLPKKGNKRCGDSYDFFMDSKGFAHLLLSDGMGTGSRAAVDSAMTCSTIRKLLQTGFGFGAAFKLMNLSFAVKSREESLATVDACTVDLYTGKTRFIKAGAASSYVKIGSRIAEFKSGSLPIGIIQGTPYDVEQTRLGKGDVIVMVSDGALISGDEWITEELKLLIKKPAKEIANELCKGARKRELPEHSDDITVVVAKLKDTNR